MGARPRAGVWQRPCGAGRAARCAESRRRARFAATPRAGCNDEISLGLRRLYYYEAMTRTPRLAAALVLLLGCAAPARADITAFFRAHTTPPHPPGRGGAGGFRFFLV